MEGEEYKYSGFVIGAIGVALIFFAVFIAFILGVEYRALYVSIGFIGFAIGVFGSIRNAIYVSKKLKEKPRKSKQPWEDKKK